MKTSISLEKEIKLGRNNESLVPVDMSNVALVESDQSGTKMEGITKVKSHNTELKQGKTGEELKKYQIQSAENLQMSEYGNDNRDITNVKNATSQKLASKINCQIKKCHFGKEDSKDKSTKNKENEIDKKGEFRRRKRCGTCTGCVLAQNCGMCGPCLVKLEGRECRRICSARKCLALKKKKSQRCGECEGCRSRPCGNCRVGNFCNGINEKLCRDRRCQIKSEKIYGLGIKIKSKSSKSDEKIRQEKMEVDDDFGDMTFEVSEDFEPNGNMKTVENVSLDPSSKRDQMGDSFIQTIKLDEEKEDRYRETGEGFGAKRSPKSDHSKIVKRMKKCGGCADCEAEACGHCQSCQINDQFGEEKLVLGKVPCLTNRCKFPTELKGGLDIATLMKSQDDTSNGAFCPVKIVNGILHDFRCFFCKKLPRVGSVNRSELMRHYSTVHYADVLRKDFQIFMIEGHCLLCNAQLKNHCIPSHIGQKHNEIVKYLPPEAIALCPEEVKKEKTGARYPPISPKTATGSNKQVLKGFNTISDDGGLRGNSSHDDGKKFDNYEIVDGWILEHNTDDPSLDYSGVGGRCSVCQREFDEVTDAVLHLRGDHHIHGGSTHLMKDCQNFIGSGFIQVSKVQNEMIPADNHANNSDENSTTATNTDVISWDTDLASESRRYSAPMLMSQRSQTSSKMKKKQANSRNSLQRRNATSPWIVRQSDSEKPSVSSNVKRVTSNVEVENGEEVSENNF